MSGFNEGDVNRNGKAGLPGHPGRFAPGKLDEGGTPDMLSAADIVAAQVAKGSAVWGRHTVNIDLGGDDMEFDAPFEQVEWIEPNAYYDPDFPGIRVSYVTFDPVDTDSYGVVRCLCDETGTLVSHEVSFGFDAASAEAAVAGSLPGAGGEEPFSD